jgi:hypothetical protein
MTELQMSCLVLTLFSLIVISGYALWRVRNLQMQLDELRHDLLKVRRYHR